MMRLALYVVIDLVVIIGTSVTVGAWAPRWPDRWLASDPILLRQLPWETPAFFRRLRVTQWAQRLPELGALFGGRSKAELPGTDRESLERYLMEARRAEWVHWASILGSLLLFLFNPWWLALAFVVAVSVGNLPFLLIVRNNRFRIQRILNTGRTGEDE